MATDAFSFSATDMILLRKMFKKAPMKMRRVTAGVLTGQAFAMRPVIFKVLNKEMEIRSPRFVRSKVRVEKARSTTINAQSSKAGSIFSDRFTGWKEQQFGKESKEAKIYTRFSRGGSWAGKVRPKLRRRQTNPLWRPSDFNIRARSEKHRLIIFLQMLDKKKITDRFFMPDKLGRMQRGIYKMERGRIRRVSKDEFQKPRKIAWMDKSIDLLLREVNIKELYADNVRHVFKLR